MSSTMRDAGAIVGALPAMTDHASAPGPRGPGADVALALRQMLAEGELDLPMPGSGRTAWRWAALAEWGGRDLSLARLAEGHVDALAVLAEAGRAPVPGALYGVWASRSGGAAVRVERHGAGRVLNGTLRFCSGARVLDRALVVADRAADRDAEPATERLLLDVDVTRAGVEPLPDTWCTAAMADADTLDVRFDGVPVADGADVGEPGWYVARRGFAYGGAGVAAVWWGGAAAILDRAVGYLGTVPDRHALAHVGELHAALAATDALLQQVAKLIDADAAEAGRTAPAAAPPAHSDHRAGPRAGTTGHAAPGSDVAIAVATVRGAVERAVREVVDRVPRIVGPGPLSRDAGFARALADLALYVRQHHAERDHAALGERVVEQWRTA